MHYPPYQGTYKHLQSSESAEEVDEYEIMALAIRQGIRPEDMERMSFVSLMNILISAVEEKDTTRKASKEDIKRFVGGL